MRLFIAIELSDEIKDYLERVQGLIGEDYGISFVKKGQMHLTLKFLGEVQPEKLPKIVERLESVDFNPFMMNLCSIGVFPDEKRVRVVWAGLEPENEIIQLQKQVDEALNDLFPKEKDYRAHITLGRASYTGDSRKLMGRLKEIKVDGKKIPAAGFSLIKSTLTSRGPVYENIASFPQA